MRGKIFVVSDIHHLMEIGKFRKEMAKVLQEVRRDDLVVFLGDISGTRRDAEMTRKFYQGGIREKNSWARHYGHWLSCQPQRIIKKVQIPYIRNLKRITAVMKEISRKAQVVVVAGNRDSRFPWDFQPNKEKLSVKPEKERLILTSKEVRKAGARYVEDYFKKKLFLFLAWDGLVKGVPEEIIESVNNYDFIFAHGVPNWKLFDYPVNAEGRVVEKNFQRLLNKLANLRGVRVFYGHAHSSSYKPDAPLTITRKKNLVLVHLPLGRILSLEI